MVRLCDFGGRLSSEIQAKLARAGKYHAQGKLAEAETLYRLVLDESPHESDALHMLGLIAQQRNDPEAALQWFDAALTAKPDFLNSRFNRSVILHALKRDDEAMQSLERLFEIDPEFAPALDLYGQLLNEAGAHDKAAPFFSRALEREPNNPRFHGNYAAALVAQGDLQGAYAEARKAEALDPTFPPMILGNVLRASGRPDEAAECYARVIQLLPNRPEAYASRAMALLQMGDFEEGLALWEKRPDLTPDKNHPPFWNGQKVDSLLLYEDQGLGDTLQFLRYLPLAKERATNLVLRVPEPLAALCAHAFPFAKVVTGKTQATCGACCRLASLPFLFETRLDTIPNAPYLKASRSSLWGERLKHMKTPRIGIVWAGNPNFPNDKARSIRTKILEPLFDGIAGHFVSLQKDAKEKPPEGVFDAAPFLTNFHETAALMAELDLVISVDTAAAHLAGALGKPAFVLLPFDNDWRWMIGRESSPWYPSIRLFRQNAPADWGSVIAALSRDVRRLIEGDLSVLPPKRWTDKPLRQNPHAVSLESLARAS